MDDELRSKIERTAESHALFNALKHGGTADVSAVIGPLMAENPTFREHGDAVAPIVATVVEQVNDLAESEQHDRLQELDPEQFAELVAEPETDETTLPPLPDAEDYDEIRMRLAPNPNAPYHIGHARMPAVIGTYRDRYDGWMLCRFDDTDPETKRPDIDAYDAILEDVEYLGFEPDEVLKASDRLSLYYTRARELIERGGAYTCSCTAEAFSERKDAGEACPHRPKPIERTLTEFEAMIGGEYAPGDMVLRIKTSLDHPNPAIRDWVGFRIIDTPHPRSVASDYRCWPLLDFQSAIDDHETGITHIIRGIDLQDSAKRQQYIYDVFEWTYPEVIHWGHVQVDEYDVPLSASTITELIEQGELAGWDDPKAPTVASLRRRGIRGEAITEAMVELGTSTSNVELSMSWIYSNNRQYVDQEANRYFLVRNGREFTISGGPDTGTPPLHPDNPDRGQRTIPVDAGVLLEPEDVPPIGDRVWLKGYGCVERTETGLLYQDADLDVVRSGAVSVVHWVGASDSQEVRLRRQSGDERGLAESAVGDLPVDSLVQFERIGFARIDTQGDETVAYFAHR